MMGKRAKKVSLRLGKFGIPRKVPKGGFVWHNHVQHSVGMSDGFNGFRYRAENLPVNYREFMRCKCGVIDLPHYSIRRVGPQKCVSPEQILRNSGFTAKEARAMLAPLPTKGE